MQEHLLVPCMQWMRSRALHTGSHRTHHMICSCHRFGLIAARLDQDGCERVHNGYSDASAGPVWSSAQAGRGSGGCMCMCVCMCMFMWINVCTGIRMHVCMCMRIHVRLCLCVHVCAFTRAHALCVTFST